MKKSLLLVSALSIVPLLTSCTSSDDKTVFIEDNGKLAADSRVPAHKVWKDPSAVMANYHKIIIKDVRTDLKLDQSWIEDNEVTQVLEDEDGELKNLAVYMKKSFSDAISTQKCRMKLTNEPAPDAVTLELAIVKVTANKPLVEVGATVGAAVVKPLSLCLIPVKSVAENESKSPLTAYIAIEGRVRDSVSGKDLILFTMDSYEDSALLDVNHFTSPYANVRQIIDKWSNVLVEVINKRPLETGEKVEMDKPGVAGYTLLKL